jgi:hypothetical protein
MQLRNLINRIAGAQREVPSHDGIPAGNFYINVVTVEIRASRCGGSGHAAGRQCIGCRAMGETRRSPQMPARGSALRVVVRLVAVTL